MFPNQRRLLHHPALRTILPLTLLLVFSVVGVALLPPSAPAALAERLFESPIETPQPTPVEEVTPTPLPPTPPPEEPSPEPPTSTPVPEEPTPAPAVEQPTPLPEIEAEPAVAEPEPEPPATTIDWERFIDTMVLVFSHFWLACGVTVLLALIVIIIVLFVRSRRLEKE